MDAKPELHRRAGVDGLGHVETQQDALDEAEEGGVEAKAKADSILAESPKHLFGYVIRGEVAEQQNDAAALTTAYRDFLAAYDAEMKAGRREYLEHQPVLADFKNRASANAK